MSTVDVENKGPSTKTTPRAAVKSPEDGVAEGGTHSRQVQMDTACESGINPIPDTVGVTVINNISGFPPGFAAQKYNDSHTTTIDVSNCLVTSPQQIHHSNFQGLEIVVLVIPAVDSDFLQRMMLYTQREGGSDRGKFRGIM